MGFSDKVSSAKVAAGTWRLYEHTNYQGRFMEVGPGDCSLAEIAAKIGNDCVSSVKLAQAEIILYEHAGFKGKAVPLTNSTDNLSALVSMIRHLLFVWSVVPGSYMSTLATVGTAFSSLLELTVFKPFAAKLGTT